MEKFLFAGCDLHDENIMLKIAIDRDESQRYICKNTKAGVERMIKKLHSIANKNQVSQISFAYEASCLGYGLYDKLESSDINCYVLAPSKISRSPRSLKEKTDEKDAENILSILRGHFLAGNKLPAIKVPNHEARDNREIVRSRLNIQEKAITVKNQIVTLLKRHSVVKPKTTKNNWTKLYRFWLIQLYKAKSNLPSGTKITLRMLLGQLSLLENEIAVLDQEILKLAQKAKYLIPCVELTNLKGVGLLTAMTFLTELVDLRRFSNRQQVGSFLGLAPSSYESGKGSDRKGHITRHGPARVRKVLCQAVWSRVRTDPEAKISYNRIKKKNPKKKKIAVVAMMRRLAILMWHVGLEAQQQTGYFTSNDNFDGENKVA